ncbi:DUF5330 domain-containing protein [Agrobacterium sp. rho-13.3]|uniref:DUF5330 domain-containing protein n=1 Tax=Agrobacterium sp. rho-13.3 TaxID=3072980 RepID=UPI002A155546|nr:DUF5330 domain-containing protein [Agrobacterium sp. rho-13.3]MDX8308740.1 DUF5330 domain-containing protein [Agrobacterium sp. rho-13.3]
MWFLIKSSIFFSLVLVALSYFSGSSNSTSQTSQMNVAGAVSAASEAYRYVSAICVEKPDVCVKGAETFHALGERAREGAKVAYQLIDAQLAGSEAATKVADAAAPVPAVSVEVSDNSPDSSDDIKTGTIKSAPYIPLPQRRPAS